MRRYAALLVGVFSLCIFLKCPAPSSPPDISDQAGIDELNSLNNIEALHDSLVAGQSYACTVSVNLPGYLDSFYVWLGDSVSDTLIADGAVDDSVFIFGLRIGRGGRFELRVVAVVYDGRRDSLVKTLRVTPPVAPLLAWLGTDTMETYVTYTCSVYVARPEGIDSFNVYLSGWAGGMPVVHGPVFDSVGSFMMGMPVVGEYIVTAEALYANGSTYSAVVETLYVVPPQVGQITPQVVWLEPSSGTFSLNSMVSCSAGVSLHLEADSFEVLEHFGGVDTVVVRGQVADSVVAFGAPVLVAGPFGLEVRIRANGSVADAASVSLQGSSTAPAPVASAMQTRYVTHVRDSVEVAFHFTDPDSNLWLCEIRVESSSGIEIDSAEYGVTARASDTTGRWIVRGSSFDTIVCVARAVDYDLQESGTARCTVFVRDTLPPQIAVLTAEHSTWPVVYNLPMTLRAALTDDSPLDSATLGGDRMSIAGDTASVVLSSLDSGLTSLVLRVWDRAGNGDTAVVALDYEGDVQYPPQIGPVGATAQENALFDTIYLDAKVALTDPRIADTAQYIRDSLSWEVTGEAGKLGVTFDSTTRTVVITAPDTVLRQGEALSEVVTFRVTDTRGWSDEAIGVYVLLGVNDKPVVNIFNQGKCGSTTKFDTLELDTSFRDEEDTAGSPVTWEFTNGKHLRIDSVRTARRLCLPPSLGGTCQWIYYPTSRIVIVPDTSKPGVDTNWVGVDTLAFKVKDSDGMWSDRKEVIFSRVSVCIIDPHLPPVGFPRKQAEESKPQQ